MITIIMLYIMIYMVLRLDVSLFTPETYTLQAKLEKMSNAVVHHRLVYLPSKQKVPGLNPGGVA